MVLFGVGLFVSFFTSSNVMDPTFTLGKNLSQASSDQNY